MSSLKDLASLIMIPSLYKDGELHTVKPLADEDVILHPDATGNNDGNDGTTDRTADNFTFSRGSNLAATRVDVNGLIEKGRENLYLHSNNFNTSWSPKAGIFAQGVTDPNGGNTAWSWTANNTDPYLYQYWSASGVHCVSIYAKGSGNTIGHNIEIRIAGSINYFELTSEWQRFEAFGVLSGSNNIGFEFGNPTATSGDVIHIYGAQFEKGLVATDYIETGASTAQAGILEDMPRLDYSGGASCPALLLEPQRTNLVTQSEYYDTGNGYFNSFALHDIITNTTATTSPTGDYSASKIIPDTSDSSNHNIYGSNVTSGTKYAVSIFAKAAEYDYLIIRGLGLGGSGGARFNISTGVVEGVAGYDSATIEDYGNGWYRCIAIGTSTSTTGAYYHASPTAAFTSFQGNNSDGIYIYGAQIEVGSYPTSYIPTMGASVTRSGDSCFLQNADVHSSGAGTIFFETGDYDTNTSASGFNKILWTGDEVGINDVIYFEEYAGNNTILIRKNNSTLLQSTPSYQDLTGSKIAIKWSSEEAKIFIDGVLNITYTGDASNTFEYFGYDNPYNGQIESTLKIKQRVHFNTALTDSECIALTTL